MPRPETDKLLPLSRVERGDLQAFAAKLRARVLDQSSVEKQVHGIIERVRKKGDKALMELVRELDHSSVEQLRVDQKEIRAAVESVDAELTGALKFSFNRIARTQGQLMKRLRYAYVSDGFVVRTALRPLDSVGCYVPGGRAAYSSSVLMTAGVAKLAGVRRVIVCSPPGPDGKVNPAILAASSICGVDEVYAAGGAQSIAAMAYGTKTISRVQKVVGPGGLYASVAKRLVSSEVPIDFFAGPTELVIVGDRSADVRSAAWDLVGQAEHGEDTLCGFVTWDSEVADRVRKQAAKIAGEADRGDFVRRALSRGFVALCRDREEAALLVNAIAPEHLEVIVKDSGDFASRVENAGLVLLGKFAPCAASDYVIGTDHVIPTGGYARLRTGLSVLDFTKLNWSVEGTREGLKRVLPPLRTMARAEGLPNHYRSVESRFKR